MNQSVFAAYMDLAEGFVWLLTGLGAAIMIVVSKLTKKPEKNRT